MTRFDRSFRQVSRRAILRGLGVSLTLPFLESIAPREVRAQPSAPVQRYVVIYFPVGVTEFWRPATTGTGAEWQLSPILAPLQHLKGLMNVYSGVENYAALGTRTPNPSHSRLCAALLTCSDCAEGNIARNDTSIDQLIASHWRGSTAIDSLQVGLAVSAYNEDARHPANSRSISWAGPTRPLYKTVNPAAVFDALMAARAPSASGELDALAQRRRALGKSSLDYVLDQAQTLHGTLNPADRVHLDNFLQSVRELEQRTVAPAMRLAAPASCPTVTRPRDEAGLDLAVYSRQQHFEVMSDLVVLALQCDLTRVVTYMLDDARSNFLYRDLKVRHFTPNGSTETAAQIALDHHATSHIAESDPFSTIVYYFAERLAQFCEKLRAVPDGDGNLLDNTLVFFGSGIEGPLHRADNLPVLSVGSAGGRLKVDNHYSFAEERRLADLHLTVAQRGLGVQVDKFANSTGIVPEMVA